MPLPSIPHARDVFESLEPPLKTLHVVTDLMHLSSSQGFDPEAHYEMMEAIGRMIGPRCKYDRYVVHAPDHP